MLLNFVDEHVFRAHEEAKYFFYLFDSHLNLILNLNGTSNCPMQARTQTRQQAFEILLLENNLQDAELVMQALKENNIHKDILHVSEKNGLMQCIDDAVTCYGYLPFRLIILNL